MTVCMQDIYINLRFVTSWEASNKGKQIRMNIMGEGLRIFTYSDIEKMNEAVEDLQKYFLLMDARGAE